MSMLSFTISFFKIKLGAPYIIIFLNSNLNLEFLRCERGCLIKCTHFKLHCRAYEFKMSKLLINQYGKGGKKSLCKNKCKSKDSIHH